MTITVIFDPPLPSNDPAVFDSKAFALLGDLNDWSAEANALAADVNSKQATASGAATTATTQAGLAATAKADAEAAAVAALGAYDSFDDRYLGSKAANPTLDNDGNALIEGALYWNSVAKEMRAWNATAWVTSSAANAVSRSGDTMTGPLAQAAGTAALPSYTFTGSLSTGMWSPAPDTLGWSIAGVERMRLSSNGRLRHTANNEQFGVQLNNGATANGPYLGSSGADVFTLSASSGATIGDWSAANGLLVKQATGLGYGTGSGGSVTQPTSKSTAVALNKPCGQITMNNAALAAGASVQFQVNNNLAAGADAVVLNITGGTANASSYRVIGYVQGNAFFVRLTNESGGSLSDAVVINFAIIKGATS